MSALLELSIFPLDKGDSLSDYVARAVTVIKESGLAYNFGPMSTSVEGEWDELLDLVTKCKDALDADCNRIVVHMRIDYKKGPAGRITTKVTSVEEKIPGGGA